MDSTPANSQIYTCTACVLPARAQVKAGDLMTVDMMVRDPRLYAVHMIVHHLLCRHWDDPQYLLWKEDNVDVGEVKERTLEHTFAPSKVHLSGSPVHPNSHVHLAQLAPSTKEGYNFGSTPKQHPRTSCSLPTGMSLKLPNVTAIHLWQYRTADRLACTKQRARMTSYTKPRAWGLQNSLHLACCWSLSTVIHSACTPGSFAVAWIAAALNPSG